MNRTAPLAPVPPTRLAARLRRRCGALAASAAAGALLAATALPLRAEGGALRAGDIAPFEIVYDVGNNLITAGVASLTLRRADGHWTYTLSTKPTGVFKLTGKGRIRETSVFDLVPAGDGDEVELRPRSYSYRQDKESRREVDAAFDWDTRRLAWRRRGEADTLSFTEPVLDRLSVTLVVMNLLREGFERIELDVFDSGQIKSMSFDNEGVQTLDTKIGKIETIRVRGRNAAGSSRTTLTWFAPSLDYVPVRLEQHKRRELVARMNLLKLENRVTDLELVDPDALDAPVRK